jgi:hypothetical protein
MADGSRLRNQMTLVEMGDAVRLDETEGDDGRVVEHGV